MPAAPGTVIPSGTGVGPGGDIGIPGSQAPLANATQNGLLRQVSGSTGDFVDGTNNCQTLAPVIWSARLRSWNSVGNCSFEVDQRNAGGSVADQPWGQDRWSYNKSGTMSAAAFQGTPSLLPLVPGTNFLIGSKVLVVQLLTQATLGASDYLFLNQVVEGPNFRELSQDVHSLSLLVYSSVALKFAAALRDPGSAHSLVKLCTIPTANTWTLIPLPNLPIWMSAGNFSMVPGSAGYMLSICLACGSNFLAPATDVWQTGNFIGAAGMDNFASKPVNTSQFIMGFVQHEPGPVCTTFQDKGFTSNLDECQRYYQKSYDYATAIGTATALGRALFYIPYANWHAYLPIYFRKQMAKDPTVIGYSPVSGAANNVRNESTGADVPISGANTPSQTGFGGFTLNPPPTTAALMDFHYTADTGW